MVKDTKIASCLYTGSKPRLFTLLSTESVVIYLSSTSQKLGLKNYLVQSHHVRGGEPRLGVRGEMDSVVISVPETPGLQF